MGWWESEDGRGVIGDRPVDIVDAMLVDSLGERFRAELFQGFLGAVGAALARNPSELLADGLRPERTVFVVAYEDDPPARVPVIPPLIQTSLDDAVYAMCRDVAGQYRLSVVARPPYLAEVLETVAFAARPRIEDARLERVVTRSDERDDGLPLWAATRALLARRAELSPGEQAVVAQALASPDWRARMTAALVAGRARLAELAPAVAAVEAPAAGRHLREDDRRALLALRDVAAARAAGVGFERPVHPDADVAAARAALLTDVRAAIDGADLPGPGSPAYVVHALADPETVAADPAVPPQWRGWLTNR